MKRIAENFLILLVVVALLIVASPLLLLIVVLKVVDWLLVKLHLKQPRFEEKLSRTEYFRRYNIWPDPLF